MGDVLRFTPRLRSVDTDRDNGMVADLLDFQAATGRPEEQEKPESYWTDDEARYVAVTFLETATAKEMDDAMDVILNDLNMIELFKNLVFCHSSRLSDAIKEMRMARLEIIKRMVLENDLDFPFYGE